MTASFIDSLSVLHTPYKQYRMTAALAAVIILGLNIVFTIYEQSTCTSYTGLLTADFPSYKMLKLAEDNSSQIQHTSRHCLGADLLSNNPLMEPTDASYIAWVYHYSVSYRESHGRKNRCRRWVEKRDGGNGQAVACYVRVSSSHQANEGFSVDAQIERLRKLIGNCNPSEIHWFVDPGMTGTRFDNRAVVDILELRKHDKISELWVSEIDRIGRDAPKLIMFFFNFCEDGGRIRTPDALYDNSRDLSNFIVLAVKAFSAQDSNQARSKASVAGKGESFRRKNWNKSVPPGYTRNRQWIKRISEWEPIIRAIFTQRLDCINESRISDRINTEYSILLKSKLKARHIKAILADPVYVGKPEHLGVVVEDTELAFIDQKTFDDCQKLIDNSDKQEKPLDALQELLAKKHVWAIDFIEKETVLVHKGCGGRVVKNGAVTYDDIRQQLYLCNKCNDQWRVPSMAQLDEQKRTLIDPARDLLKEVADNRKNGRKQKRENLDSQSGSLARWFVEGQNPKLNPDFHILFLWLFQ